MIRLSRLAPTAPALLVGAVLLLACTDDATRTAAPEPDAPEHVATLIAPAPDGAVEHNGPPSTRDDSAERTPDRPEGTSADTEHDLDTEDDSSASMDFPRRDVAVAGTWGGLEPAEAVASPVGPRGGTLRSGNVTLTIPEGAMREQRVVTLEVVGGAEALDRPLPPSPVFGGIVGGPWNLEFTRAASLTVPLDGTFPPGQPLQLLAWQPGFLSYTIIARADVDSTGEQAIFPVSRLGRMTIRPEPVRAPNAAANCAQPRPALRASIPAASEDATVGLVDRQDRIGRAEAFAWLTDFRRTPRGHLAGFKNEEVRNSPRTRRDERNHQDEDFLMDPNLAAGVAILARLVAEEWVCPLSGVPAFQVRLTEAYDSFIEHSERSTHYQGRAADLTLDPVPGASLVERRRFYGRLAALGVCAGLDWVLFEDAFHVHASVTPTVLAWISRGSDGRLTLWSRRLGGEATVHERAQSADELTGAARRRGLRDGNVSARTLDEQRELRIVDGRLYWSYADGGLPLASRNANDARFPVEPAVRVDTAAGEVIEAWVVPHGETLQHRDELRSLRAADGP